MTRDAGSGIIHSFLVKKKSCLPLCLSLCRSTAREIWFIKQSSASASPATSYTHTLFPETKARPPPHAGDVPFPIPTLLLPCVSLPASGSRWG